MKIVIKDLTFKCILGILPKERVKKQKVIIQFSCHYNYQEGQFVDYSKIAKEIESIMKKKKFQLIEEALLYIKNRLKTRYPITKINLTIEKPTILKNCSVSVTA